MLHSCRSEPAPPWSPARLTWASASSLLISSFAATAAELAQNEAFQICVGFAADFTQLAEFFNRRILLSFYLLAFSQDYSEQPPHFALLSSSLSFVWLPRLLLL